MRRQWVLYVRLRALLMGGLTNSAAIRIETRVLHRATISAPLSISFPDSKRGPTMIANPINAVVSDAHITCFEHRRLVWKK